MRGAVLFGLVLRLMHIPPATTLKIEQHIYLLAGMKMIVAMVIIMVLVLVLVATKPFGIGKLKGEPGAYTRDPIRGWEPSSGPDF